MMCHTHNRIHTNGLPERRDDQCAHFSGQRRCEHTRILDNAFVLCERHNTLAINANIRREAQRVRIQQERDARRAIIVALLAEFAGNMAAWTWRAVTDELLRRTTLENTLVTLDIAYGVGLRYAMRFFGVHPVDYDNYHRWAQGGRQGPLPAIGADNAQPHGAPPGEHRGLGHIAADRQNVHTAPVSRQTNENLEHILRVDTTSIGSRSVERIGSMWLLRSFSRMHDKFVVLDDMSKWYAKSYCRSEGDHLYKRTLDGAFALILRTADTEVRRELVKRLFEECFESVGMCCDGHISRLCNVFVGFHDAFKSEVSVSEQLQDKIAMIAGLDMSRDAKIERATAVFEELHVAPAERIAWLEALE